MMVVMRLFSQTGLRSRALLGLASHLRLSALIPLRKAHETRMPLCATAESAWA
jgi:hypothetical protein